MPKINKREIARVLENMGKRIKEGEVSTEDGKSLDFKKFNAHIAVVGAVAELKSLGVKDKNHLAKLGFVPAGMIINF